MQTFLTGVFLAFLATAPSALGAAGFLALGVFAGVFLAFTTFLCDKNSLEVRTITTFNAFDGAPSKLHRCCTQVVIVHDVTAMPSAQWCSKQQSNNRPETQVCDASQADDNLHCTT